MGAKSLLESKFEQRIPSAQAAVDIFSGKWASNLSQILPVTGTGTANLFNDPRVKLAAAALGANGRVNGMRILEVGPLEGAHTYLLEQLGAGSVTAVESNTEAFLKCILVKDMLGLKANFLCGDAVLFLKESDEQYDLVFCSGFLYHLMDPLETIRLICSRTSRCFVWTHYHQEGHTAGVNRIAETASRDGFETTYWTFSYPDRGYDKFWGGNKPSASLMERDEIIRAFSHFGLTSSRVLQETVDHSGDASFSVALWR